MSKVKTQKLYHGSTNEIEGQFNPGSFFSSSYSFSDVYGEVYECEVELGTIFDSANPKHIQKLLDITNLYDNYNEVEVTTLEEFEEYSNNYSDTWEIIEGNLSDIYGIEGVNSIRIFEGGVENYIVKESKQILKFSKINNKKTTIEKENNNHSTKID